MGAAIPPGPLGPVLRVGVALGALAGATALFHYVVPGQPDHGRAQLPAPGPAGGHRMGAPRGDPARRRRLPGLQLLLPAAGRPADDRRAGELGELRRLHVDGDRGLAALGPGPRPPPRRGGPPTRPGAAVHPQPRPAARGRGRGRSDRHRPSHRRCVRAREPRPLRSAHGGDRAGGPDRPARHRRQAAGRGPSGDHPARARRARRHGGPARPDADRQPRACRAAR